MAVIGMGNVAVDIVRVLGKPPAEMAASDLCGHAASQIAAAPITALYLIGRRGPVDAPFTSTELAELGRLARVRPAATRAAPPASTAKRRCGKASDSTCRSQG